MEASGADLEAAADASVEQIDVGPGSVGNGIVVVVGIFAPGDVVSLLARGEGDVRAGGGGEVGKRVVDEDGQVGFAGLEPGALFFAVGYSAGRYVEVHCVAQDPALGVTLLQPPVQPSPTTLGTTPTPAPVAPAAPPEGLEVGLPEGVQSPLLTPCEISPGELEGEYEISVGDDAATAAPVETATGGAVGETPTPDGGAAAPAADQSAGASSEEAEAPAGAGGATEADAGAVPAVPPADAAAGSEGPTFGSSAEPGAADGAASGDAQADGAPAESAPVDGGAPSGDVATQSETDGTPASAATGADASQVEQPGPSEGAGAPASPTTLEQLAAQAEGLGIEGAHGSSDEAWLRQAITERNVTPVV